MAYTIVYGLRFVITDGNIILFSIIFIFFVLQYIFIRKIDYKVENKTSAFKSTMKHLFKYLYRIS